MTQASETIHLSSDIPQPNPIGLSPHSQTYSMWGEKCELWLDMSPAEIKKLVYVNKNSDSQQVLRERKNPRN
jgi:hypothetical protein